MGKRDESEGRAGLLCRASCEGAISKVVAEEAQRIDNAPLAPNEAQPATVSSTSEEGQYTASAWASSIGRPPRVDRPCIARHPFPPSPRHQHNTS